MSVRSVHSKRKRLMSLVKVKHTDPQAKIYIYMYLPSVEYIEIHILEKYRDLSCAHILFHHPHPVDTFI